MVCSGSDAANRSAVTLPMPEAAPEISAKGDSPDAPDPTPVGTGNGAEGDSSSDGDDVRVSIAMIAGIVQFMSYRIQNFPDEMEELMKISELSSLYDGLVHLWMAEMQRGNDISEDPSDLRSRNINLFKAFPNLPRFDEIAAKMHSMNTIKTARMRMAKTAA